MVGSNLAQIGHVFVVGVLVVAVSVVRLGILLFEAHRTKVLAEFVMQHPGIPSFEVDRIVALAGTVGQLLDILNPIRKVDPLYNSRTHDKEMVPYWKGCPAHGRSSLLPLRSPPVPGSRVDGCWYSGSFRMCFALLKKKRISISCKQKSVQKMRSEA